LLFSYLLVFKKESIFSFTYSLNYYIKFSDGNITEYCYPEGLNIDKKGSSSI
jgi:hypothetical protein